MKVSEDKSSNEAVESRRLPGVGAIWVARNRYAVLEKNNYIVIRDLANKDNKKVDNFTPIEDIFYAGTGLLLLKNTDSIHMFDIQQKRVLASIKVPKVILQKFFFNF